MAGADTGSEVTEEQIRHRAYEISQGPDGGTEEENWIRAEQELRNGSDAPKAKPRARTSAADDS